MSKVLILSILALCTVQSNVVSAKDRKPAASGDPKCFQYLKSHMGDFATDGYVVASTTSFAYAHDTIRGSQREVVYQAEMSNGSDQMFRYVTLDAGCSQVLGMSGLSNQ